MLYELSRQEVIEKIMEVEDDLGYGEDLMPKKSTEAELSLMDNSQVLSLLEDLTSDTNDIFVIKK